MTAKVNLRWAAFKRLYPEGKSWEYVAFIGDMRRELYGKDGRVRNHDEFTGFISKKVELMIKEKI